jgi:hypothetical protein
MTGRLDGKVAIISGGARGQGAAEPGLFFSDLSLGGVWVFVGVGLCLFVEWGVFLWLCLVCFIFFFVF